MARQFRVTINDEAIYSALSREAKHSARSADDIIEEALRDWLDAQDDLRDENVIRERLASYRAEGGVALEDVLKERKLNH